MDIQEIYRRLDEIDEDLVELFIDRMIQNAELAEYKLRNGLPVMAGKVEERKIDIVRNQTKDRFIRESLEEFYKQIMTVSRRYQYLIQARHGVQVDTGFRVVDELPWPKRVVYQGVEGAYGNMAAVNYFSAYDGVEFYHVPRFEDALVEVEEDRADFCVLPIENSTAGSVVDTYDILMRHGLTIVGEYFLPIRHSLLGVPGAKLSEIRTVTSHIQGLLQCAEFFREHPEIRQETALNTAVAAQKVRDDGDPTQAAIASAMAGEIYGLETLVEGVNRNDENTTRFIVLGREKIHLYNAKKVSMIFETPHEAGALYNILGNFFFNHVNIVKLESRPIPDVSWEYRFFIDIEGSLNHPAVINAINSVAQQAKALRILGNY